MCSCMPFPSPAAAPLAVRRRALQCLQVPQRERARLEEIRDQQPGGPAEQVQQVLDQPAAVLALVDRRLEQLRIANLRRLAQRALLLEPVDERLHRRVRDALVLRQAVEDLADGAGPQLPVLLEDSCLGFGKAGFAHRSTTPPGSATTSYGNSPWKSSPFRTPPIRRPRPPRCRAVPWPPGGRRASC